MLGVSRPGNMTAIDRTVKPLTIAVRNLFIILPEYSLPKTEFIFWQRFLYLQGSRKTHKHFYETPKHRTIKGAQKSFHVPLVTNRWIRLITYELQQSALHKGRGMKKISALNCLLRDVIECNPERRCAVSEKLRDLATITNMPATPWSRTMRVNYVVTRKRFGGFSIR